MALKFTVHVVQSFIKGHRKSGEISIKHSRDITHRINPLTVGSFSTYDCHNYCSTGRRGELASFVREGRVRGEADRER